ncbi:MAG: carbohydrate-binding domain-containing protein [Alloprevotella sp.]|nr:carbohydrate-binding domain-containing protein [Alloprevotella sp.]
MTRKILLLIACALLLATGISAQSLRICQGALTVGVPAASADTMRYSDGGATLTVMGRSYDVSSIESIVYSTDDVLPQTVYVTYEGTSAKVFASGDVAPYLTVDVSGADVSITASDDLAEEITYVLSGNSSDGSFLHTGSLKSTIELAGLTLTNTRGAAIDIENGKRIAVLVDEGTTNTLADGSGGTQKACFFIKGHAEFQGGGTLNITGNAKHAFASNEYTELKSSFGTLNILGAASDGLHIEQYYEQKGGTVSIKGCTGDGIDCSVTNDATDELNGQLLLSGGTVTVDLGTAEDVKGIKCDSVMTISGGTVTITGSGNGVKGIKAGTNLLINQCSGNTTSVSITVTGTTYHKDQADESKTRGMKVGGDFTFDGGTITISATGSKAKAVSVDGTYYYRSGSINCSVDATNVG